MGKIKELEQQIKSDGKLISSLSALIAKYPPEGFNTDVFILLIISNRDKEVVELVSKYLEMKQIQTLAEV